MPFFYIYYEKCVKGVLSPDDYGFSPHFPTHCTLKTEYDSKTSPCPSHYVQRERGLVKPHCDDGTGK